ncbi:hypothetical protein [Rhodopirellula baltica]|uniref:Immunity protein Imm1 n=1 Tax=Rhodopirellula baltica WH47 TaxID=991778 RepID=F2AZL5_RHOBT|nr:hypothetical protein [Rhodopirellula baltica]EGF24894.1 hypothetical protein RBWH47_03545 [Rhodopirellula baltica WH47]
MQIHDLSGSFETDDAAQIADRLRTVRNGLYGASFVAGDSAYPCVAVHFNSDVAYIHYFPTDGHAGFQPSGMTPSGVIADVHFLNVDGDEAGAYDMAASAVVDAETAIAAVLEFAANLQLPPSIDWFEL